MAWGLEGDSFPRVILCADPTDFGTILVGDGTFDPSGPNGAIIGGLFNGQHGLTFKPGNVTPDSAFGNSNGTTVIAGGTVEVGQLTLIGGISQDDFAFADGTVGPVLVDQSDGHTYRIIATAGVLSTVQVT